MLEIKRKPNSPGGIISKAAMPQPDPSGVSLSSIQPSVSRQRLGPPVVAPSGNGSEVYQMRLPVIVGEAQYKGTLRLDGIASGQLGGNGGSLSVRQRTRPYRNEPEFSGEVSFRDMIRVNGHIAGTVYSKVGTLIVDLSATVDANIEVGVAVISGAVNGDIVAHQRVEIGPRARIHGNIWTRSIEIKNGAIFEGVCRMLADEQIAG